MSTTNTNMILFELQIIQKQKQKRETPEINQRK